MLYELDPVVAWLADAGWNLVRLAVSHRYALAGIVSAYLVALLVGAIRRPVERSVALGACALTAATWGQVLLLSDLLLVGWALYALAFALGVLLARQTPLPNGRAPRRPVTALEVLAFAGLLALAALARLHALAELPPYVDIEPAAALLQSLSRHGLAHYIEHNRVLDDGFVHMPMRAATLALTTPSILGVRFAAVAWGVLAVAACYGLARSLLGVPAAVMAALLLLSAPEQLYWSRIETTQFIPVSTASAITAYLSLWLAQTWSWAAALVTALWMPFCRYFYAAAIGLPALPPALLIYALACGRTRARALRALPILAAGLVLWTLSSPLLHYAATGDWRHIPTTHVYGAGMLAPHDPEGGPASRQPLGEAVSFQVRRFAQHTWQLLQQLGYRREGYSHWYQKTHPDPEHMRMVSAGLLILFIPALGYLAGQPRQPRAVTLMIWVLVTILPGVMSTDPEPRRVAGLFVAIVVIAVLFVTVLVRAASAARSAIVREGLPAGMYLLVATIVLTSLASHYQLRRGPLLFQDYIEFTRPYFTTSDVIFHNIDDPAIASILVFGNADVFRQRLPCYHLVKDWTSEWSVPTDDFACPFTHDVYASLLSREDIRNRSGTFSPSRVTYLLQVDQEDDRELARELARRLPTAELAEYRGTRPSDPIHRLVALSVGH